MDMGPDTEVTDAARQIAPFVLGALFLAYIIVALFPPTPTASGIFNALSVISLFLSVAFAGFLANALYRQRESWRLWAVLLGISLGIWAAGYGLFSLLPRPFA